MAYGSTFQTVAFLCNDHSSLRLCARLRVCIRTHAVKTSARDCIVCVCVRHVRAPRGRGGGVDVQCTIYHLQVPLHVTLASCVLGHIAHAGMRAHTDALMQDEYSQALDVAHEDEPSRAVYFANRAACRLKLKQLEEAAQDCTHATNIDQGYLKAWIRRCTAYEQLNQYERALGDAKKV